MRICNKCAHYHREEEEHLAIPTIEIRHMCLCPQLQRTNPVNGRKMPADPFIENEDIDCPFWKEAS